MSGHLSNAALCRSGSDIDGAHLHQRVRCSGRDTDTTVGSSESHFESSLVLEADSVVR